MFSCKHFIHLSDQHQLCEEQEGAEDEDERLTSARFTKQLREQVAYRGDETLDCHKLGTRMKHVNSYMFFFVPAMWRLLFIRYDILHVCQH